ncbi:hypothetical protein A3Q56_05216, partial [Intoshia linei]
MKRNFSVPELSKIVDWDCYSSNMIKSYISSFVDFAKHKLVCADKITLNANCIHVPNKINLSSLIASSRIFHFTRKLDTYYLSIKRVPKPNLTMTALSTNATLQTIVYHSKDINAIFCSMFKELKQRIILSLEDHVKLYCDMSPKDFANEIRNMGTDVKYLFSGDDSILMNKTSHIEIDISKYDKFQGIVAPKYDCMILKYYGILQYYINLWYNGHFLSIIYEPLIKLKCLIPFQRKSSDASTFILNITFLMGIISNSTMLNDFKMDLSNGFEINFFSSKFNLETKIFKFKYKYFCSKFLLNVGGKYHFVPDPVKILIKLGRKDLVNNIHKECYKNSLMDLCSVFADYAVCIELSNAVCE